MSTKRINVTTILPPSALFIGYVAENGVTNVEFDVSAWVTMYGSGTATLIMKRWGDANPYPIALAVDNEGLATWTISATDTAKTGFAYAQLRYEAGTKVKKSPIYTLKIGKSLGSPAETLISTKTGSMPLRTLQRRRWRKPSTLRISRRIRRSRLMAASQMRRRPAMR